MNLLIFALGIGAVQFAFTLRLRSILSRPAGGNYCPPVTVIVPCCAAGEGFDENIRSLLDQDYPGEARFLFVTQSESDPAYGRLEALLARPPRPCRLLASGLVPSCCSAKAQSLLFGVDKAWPGAEVLAFADSDLRVGRLWLRSLLAPLQEPGTGASTSMMRYFPARPDPPSLLRCAWVAWAYPYPAVLGVLCGQSMAFRRTDFDALGARKIWAGAFLEDLALVPALRARGGKVAFCGGAASVSAASASWREVFSVFDRWMLGFRIYLPSTWLLACATAAAKLWLLFHARWGLAGLILGMDWLNMLLLFGMVRMTGRPALFSILAAPLLPAAFAWSLARSAFVRESVWGKYRYRLGSGGVRAEPFADAI